MMLEQLQALRQEKPLDEGSPPSLPEETAQLLSLPAGRVGPFRGQGTLLGRGRLGAELRSLPWPLGAPEECPRLGEGHLQVHTAWLAAPPALPDPASSPSPSVGGRYASISQACSTSSHSAKLVQDRHVAPEQRLPCPLLARLQRSGFQRRRHCVSSAVVPRRCAFRVFLSSPPLFCLSGPAPRPLSCPPSPPLDPCRPPSESFEPLD